MLSFFKLVGVFILSIIAFIINVFGKHDVCCSSENNKIIGKGFENKEQKFDVRAEWKKVIDEGYRVRSSKLDGQASWQPLKNKYTSIDLKYTIKRDEIIELLKSYEVTDSEEPDLLKITIDPDIKLDNSIEVEHFFVQHFRIPFLAKNNELPLVKLMQIAYNVGQFKASKESYPKDLIDFYYDHKLDDIDFYLSTYPIEEKLN
jgi:hypothetical protein